MQNWPKIAPRSPVAPTRAVGSHRDLLAYLVRRLLENGANSSFVALAADETVPVAALLRRPADIIGSADHAGHPNIPLPRDLYRPQRTNSRGLEFGERAALDRLVAAVAAEPLPAAARIVDTTPGRGECGDISRTRRIHELETNAGRDTRVCS